MQWQAHGKEAGVSHLLTTHSSVQAVWVDSLVHAAPRHRHSCPRILSLTAVDTYQLACIAVCHVASYWITHLKISEAPAAARKPLWAAASLALSSSSSMALRGSLGSSMCWASHLLAMRPQDCKQPISISESIAETQVNYLTAVCGADMCFATTLPQLAASYQVA